MKMRLNTPGPHQRDIDRFVRAAERLWLETTCTRASTGTVYVEACDDEGDSRTYRFGSHAECYSSHDYSVCSGSTQPRRSAGVLPPGYDGWVTDAIANLRAWALREVNLTPSTA